MIKLTLPENNPNWQKIKQIYLEMVIEATPFLVEDFNQPPFTGKKIDKEDRRKKAEIGKKTIKDWCEPLYQFLYAGHDGINDFHVNSENLFKLLMTLTDEETIRKEGLDFSCSNPSALKLKKVFNYDTFAYSDKERTAKFVELLNVPVCPYCNRQFTTTVGRKGVRQNQLDHYQPKSKYPWLSLSLHNLIPSCSPCNNLKGNKKELPLYPYSEEMGTDYRFYAHPLEAESLLGMGGGGKGFQVEIISNSDKTDEKFERVKNSEDLFQLETVYNTHGDYLRSIFEQRYIFGEPYLQSILDTFKNSPEFTARFKNSKDLRSLLYMKQIEQPNWGKTPLAKFTHDIDEQISELEKE